MLSRPDQYEALAADYHWLYDDLTHRVGTATPGVRAALAGLSDHARILDAACGIGVDVAALRRRGFEVVGSDASESMLAVGRARLDDAQIDAVLLHSTWDELPTRLDGQRFDAVMCTGNSLAHSRGHTELVANLSSLAELLHPGGMLVADAQHWELIHERGDHRTTDPEPVEHSGVSCQRHYDWHVPTDFSMPFTLDLVLSFSDRSRQWERVHQVELHAFSRGEISEAARSAGLRVRTLDARDDTDRYSFLAERTDRV